MGDYIRNGRSYYNGGPKGTEPVIRFTVYLNVPCLQGLSD